MDIQLLLVPYDTLSQRVPRIERTSTDGARTIQTMPSVAIVRNQMITIGPKSLPTRWVPNS